MATQKTVAVDRISDLPEDVLHYIRSLLPVKEAARASILSKRWSSLRDTLPYLKFAAGFLNPLIPATERHLESRIKKRNKILLDFAYRFILRRRQQNAGIVKLYLTIQPYQLSKREKLFQRYFKFERWMSCVAMSCLRELHLRTGDPPQYLPSSIFSDKSINVLSLYGFNLFLLSSFDIKFPSVQKLHFSKMHLNDHIMENLILGCPLLEDLHLNCCEGLKIIYVTGLPKLKNLYVHQILGNLRMLEIDAPELMFLNVLDEEANYMIDLSARFRFNVKACPRLRKLMFWGGFLSEEWFHHFVSQCPFLENMDIRDCYNLENVKISSDTLQTLNLCKLKNLTKVEITAPNLKEFLFQAKSLPTFLLNASDMLEAELDLYSLNVPIRNDELAKFLGYFNHSRTVTLGGLLNKVTIPKDMRDNLPSPLCNAGNLVFSLCEMDFVTVDLVDYLLWLSPQAENFVYDKKNDRKNLSSLPCCKFLPNKCWRHYLAEVRVEGFEGDHGEMIKMNNFFLDQVKNLKIINTSSSASSDPLCNGLYTFYDELFSKKGEYFSDE